MPLRARIRDTPRQFATQVKERIRPLPEDEPEDVVFGSNYGLRTVELNRPTKLNSLNGSMIRKIVPRLVEYEKSDLANVVLIKGNGEKAFCAGGDVTALAKWNSEGQRDKSVAYFGLEYKLNHYIATYKKPYIAFMDGITMGGGVGLSIHAPFRIATEKTVFAMPETTIGFFPDVGASFFLPKMNGFVGTYLAMTSDRLTGPNVFYAGIATHYLHSTSLFELESRLGELRFKDYDSHARRLEVVNDTLEEFVTGMPPDQPIHLAGELRRAIDRCFSRGTVDEIVAALEQETGETKDWATKTLDTLLKRSPTSLHVTLRQMRQARSWSVAETFKKEHMLASRFMHHRDFTEGVTALLIRRDTPHWQPESLKAIPAGEDLAAPFFAAAADGQEEGLGLLTGEDYKAYPHAKFGLLTEKRIRDEFVRDKKVLLKHLVPEILAKTKPKQGLRQVVNEIVRRKVKADEEGFAVWMDEEAEIAEAAESSAAEVGGESKDAGAKTETPAP